MKANRWFLSLAGALTLFLLAASVKVTTPVVAAAPASQAAAPVQAAGGYVGEAT
jgi:hypothetical protein